MLALLVGRAPAPAASGGDKAAALASAALLGPGLCPQQRWILEAWSSGHWIVTQTDESWEWCRGPCFAESVWVAWSHAELDVRAARTYLSTSEGLEFL